MVEKVANTARRQKVQSAEVGAEVLKALARLGPSTSLSQLAEKANMPASKAHRYLKALIAGGLAEQDPVSGRYGLGAEAVFLGLTALGRIDVVAAAAAPMERLHATVNQNCILAVWANGGPTVVKVVESRAVVNVVTRIGSALPLLTSATGLVFMAYLPASETRDGLLREAAWTSKPSLAERRAADERIGAVRALGLSVIDSLNFPGVAAIAAPVFGAERTIAAAICVLGATKTFSLDPEGPVAEAVKQAADSIGARIGYRAAPSQIEPAMEKTRARAKRAGAASA